MDRETPLLDKNLRDYLRFKATPERKTVEIHPGDSRYVTLRAAAIADGRDPDDRVPYVTWIELTVTYSLVGFCHRFGNWCAVWEPYLRCDRPGGASPKEEFRQLIAETLGVTTNDLPIPIPDVESDSVTSINDGVVENVGYWKFS